MNKKRSLGLSIGVPSLVVILVVLCLVCFCGLSIVSANADLTLSQKFAERTTAYYSACSEAQQALLEASKKEPCPDSFSKDFVINENQVLSVAATLQPDVSDGNPYTITRWQVKTITSPEPDTSLPVFSLD